MTQEKFSEDQRFKGGNRGERSELSVTLSMLGSLSFPGLAGDHRVWRAEVVERDGAIFRKEKGRILRDGFPGCSVSEIDGTAISILSCGDEGKGAIGMPSQGTLKTLNNLGIYAFAGGHRGKADISALMKSDDGEKMPMHFSFKSFLGSPPSLFNAGAGATLLYRITPEPELDDVMELNAMPFRERARRLAENGCTVSPAGFDGDFGERLANIDPKLPIGLSFALACAHGLTTIEAETFSAISPFLAQIGAEHTLPRLAVAAGRFLTAGGASSEPFPDAILCLRKDSGRFELNVLRFDDRRLHDNCRFSIPIAGRSDEEGFVRRTESHGLVVTRNGRHFLALGLQIRLSDPFSAGRPKENIEQGIGILRNPLPEDLSNFMPDKIDETLRESSNFRLGGV